MKAKDMKHTYIVQYWNAGKWNTAAQFHCGSTKETWDVAWNDADRREEELIKQGYITRINLCAK